jgi:hypothetical protein
MKDLQSQLELDLEKIGQKRPTPLALFDAFIDTFLDKAFFRIFFGLVVVFLVLIIYLVVKFGSY